MGGHAQSLPERVLLPPINTYQLAQNAKLYRLSLHNARGSVKTLRNRIPNPPRFSASIKVLHVTGLRNSRSGRMA